MSQETSTNNLRIAKNTFLLYVRMIVIMLVSLYTSRVVLSNLGVDDYGIYNVVGGVVAMFSFVNGAMKGVTQRYITFALGKGNQKQLSIAFNTSLQIHFLIALLIFVLAETVGLWFLKTKMNIPESREVAAFVVYQCSILSTLVLIMSVPYNAIIVAHERMSAFAYISIVEVGLKLVIAFALTIYTIDKLIFYAILLLIVQVLIRVIYGRYCAIHFSETKILKVKDRRLFREMLSFAGWNMWGGLAVITYTQGLNIMLNLFFTPVVNAARAIAVQVQYAVQQFSVNVQTAINPQITKSYAQGNFDYMHSLIFRSSKFTFILLFIISLPLILETDYILLIWLKEVPEYTGIFLQIILCITIIDAVSNPLMTGAQASGKIRLYQLVVGGIQLLILPISYIVLKLGHPPYYVFIVHFSVSVAAYIIRIFIVKPLIKLSLREYLRKVIIPCVIIVLSAFPIPFFVKSKLVELSFVNFLVVCFVSVICVSVSANFFGLNKSERLFIRTKLLSFIKKYNFT